MKKFLLTLGVIFASLTASAQLVFVDAEGKELADGATVTMDKTGYNDFEEFQVGLEGISVKNTTDKGMRFNLTFQVTEIPSGSFTCCFGGTCLAPVSKPSELLLEQMVSKANAVDEILSTEWVPAPGKYGTCKVTISLSTGRTLNVNFVYADPSPVQGITLDKKIAGYFDATGKPQDKLQKGLNLVRYTDGTVRKVIR